MILLRTKHALNLARFNIVSCPAPSNAKSEKGSGLPCIEPVSPVQPTVRANQMQEQSHMTGELCKECNQRTAQRGLMCNVANRMFYFLFVSLVNAHPNHNYCIPPRRWHGRPDPFSLFALEGAGHETRFYTQPLLHKYSFTQSKMNGKYTRPVMKHVCIRARKRSRYGTVLCTSTIRGVAQRAGTGRQANDHRINLFLLTRGNNIPRVRVFEATQIRCGQQVKT